MSVANLSSEWVSGNLVFFETGVGQSATGDVLTLGTTAVKVGGTSQDVDFQFYTTGSKSFIIDAGAGTITIAKLSSQYNLTSSFGIAFGAKSSSAAVGHPIGVANSADTAGDKAIAVFADDANAVLLSDAQGINSRCLILHAQTGTYGMTALRGHLRVVANITPSASKGFYATENYVEASGTYTIGDGTNLTILAAAGASVELGGTPTIAANAVVCGLHISGKTLPGSPTGEAVGILFQALAQGYEHAIGFTGVGSTDGNGLVVQSGGTLTCTHKIAVWINGVGTRYIGVGTIA